ncbi:hypothetical protein H6G97_43910 [Nostoc flagelliforme FACHB-838]|uniref:Uncharacterized protein n=1 Tax=Nostoc flagelliforme FACHB-838 TaxID=2692904 RepID=A0ABR8E2K0_9NOSO|nr:hypothetical protein [Nostoc flagelliforme FACHB-838]
MFSKETQCPTSDQYLVSSYTNLVKRVIDASKSSRFIDVYSVRLTLPQMVVSHAHLIVTSLSPLPP